MGVNKRPAEEETVAVTVIANEEMDVEVDTSDSSPPNAKKIKKSPPKKKKKSILGLIAPSQPKNPVALLNELRQNLIFDLVSQTGPVHAPVFTMKVAVSGSCSWMLYMVVWGWISFRIPMSINGLVLNVRFILLTDGPSSWRRRRAIVWLGEENS